MRDSFVVDQVQIEARIPAAQAGDRQAVDFLVKAHIRLITQEVLRMTQRFREWREDLLSEGVMGFMHAIKKYDEAKGAKLATYGMLWVRAYVSKFMMTKVKAVNSITTSEARSLYFNLYRLEKRSNEYQTDEDLAKQLGAEVGDVTRFRQASRNTAALSLEKKVVNKNGDSLGTLMNLLPDQLQTVEEVIGDAQEEFYRNNVLELFLKTRNPRERYIWDSIVKQGKTLKDIGIELGITRERVRQIIERMKEHLQIFAKRKKLTGEFKRELVTVQ